jgi:hypothetical protein
MGERTDELTDGGPPGKLRSKHNRAVNIRNLKEKKEEL